MDYIPYRAQWRLKSLVTALLLVLLGSALAWKPSPSRQKVLLSQVETLTLFSDRMTEYRRTEPIPQLDCVGGDAMKYGYRVEAMQCKNMGGSYGDAEDTQWSCTAEIPDDFKLGRTEVVCEGYASPDDPYVLKGSCGVEYTLHLTPKGREKYHGQGYRNPFSDFPTFAVPKVSLWKRFTSNFFLFTWFRWITDLIKSIVKVVVDYPILLLATIYFSYRLLRWFFLTVFEWLWPRAQAAQRRVPRRSFWPNFFGGGGGGWWGGDDPGSPPPYTQRPPSFRKTYYVPHPDNQGWTPGFWTGLASGTAVGYGLGSRGSGSGSGTQTREQPRYNTRSSTASPPPQSSGWFGGGNSQSNNGWFSGSASYNPPDSSSSPSRRDRDDNGSSGSTYTSTGFGSTRRR